MDCWKGVLKQQRLSICAAAAFLALALLPYPVRAQGNYPLGPYATWSCPGPAEGGPGYVTVKGRTGRLYLHAEDTLGNDFEIWCIKHWYGFNYEYVVSYPNGKTCAIAKCEFDLGMNVKSLDTIGTDSIGTLPNGGALIKIKGEITKAYYHNFDAGKNFHVTYDFATGKFTRSNTVIAKDSDGVRREKIVKTESQQVSRTKPPKELYTRNHQFLKQSFPYLPNAVRCGGEGELDENRTIREEKVVWTTAAGRKKSAEILHPGGVKISSVKYQAALRTLQFSLPRQASDYLNVSIPRELVDHTIHKKFRVLVNGKETPYEEGSSSTHRTLTLFTAGRPADVVITDASTGSK